MVRSRRLPGRGTATASIRSGEVLWAALTAIACVGALLVCTELKTMGTAVFADPGWDRHMYVEMARGGVLDFRLAPYCWRVLVPLLAGTLPMNLQAGFMALTVTAVTGAGAALFGLVRQRGHPPAVAMVTVVLFYALGWGPKFILADFWIPDGVALFLLILAFWAALRGEAAAFAAILLVGAATKESVLAVAPLFYTLNARRPLDPRLAGRTMAAVAPAMLLAVLIRLLVDERNGDLDYLAMLPSQISRFPELVPDYSYRSLLVNIGYEQRFQDRTLGALARYTTGSFGLAVPLLALAGMRRAWRLALRLSPFIVLTYAQLLVATDTQRLLVLASPALLLVAVEGMAELRTRTGIRPSALVLPACVLFVLVLLDRQTYSVPIERQALVLLASAAGMIVARMLRRTTGAAPGGP